MLTFVLGARLAAFTELDPGALPAPPVSLRPSTEGDSGGAAPPVNLLVCRFLSDRSCQTSVLMG